MRATTIFTTGVDGSGKSYVRCARFLVDEFLPNKTGVHYSNFPVNVDAIVEHFRVKKGYSDEACEDIRRRVRVIPFERTEEWRLGTNPENEHPADFFRKPELCGLPAVPSAADPSVMVADLSRVHIAIDEIHNFAGQHTAKATIAKWQAWLGELRHCGATFEMLSQDHVKIAPSLRNEASMRYEVVDGGIKIDPVFLISFYDWWQLKAKVTGSYRATSWLEEVAKVGARREHVVKSWPYPRDPYYFRFYDSHTAAIQSGQQGEEEPLEFQKYSWWQLLKWFCSRNGEQLTKRGAMVFAPFVVCAVVWFWPGGFGKFLEGIPAVIKSVVKNPGFVQADGSVRTAGDVARASSNSSSKGRTAGEGKGSGPARSAVEGEASGEDVEGDEFEAITYLAPDRVAFGHGIGYGVGERIERGAWRGLEVKAIDLFGGVVVLDGDVVVRFGLRGKGDPPRAAGGSGVAEGVRNAVAKKPAIRK